MEIPPYNKNAVCPKCGCPGIRTQYCGGVNSGTVCDLGLDKDHLHRVCTQCGYKWAERALNGLKNGKQQING